MGVRSLMQGRRGGGEEDRCYESGLEIMRECVS
jgi:hypothetical protein